MFVLGDAIGRRYFSFLSAAHRLASAFLIGLLVSSWWTYALAYAFGNSASPMLWGNVLFFVTAIGAIYWLRRNPPKDEPKIAVALDGGFERWDWVITGIFLLFATWMMFRTFAMGDGNVMIGHHQFPDFGSTLSIMQSFALGHNFPTQYPHFSGERIRYHFLFYFQAGNFEYLGLSPAFANNILSIFSLTSLLVLVMTMGKVLFNSRIAGRIGAALFFFHGSLSFIPFLRNQASFSALLEKLNTMTPYLVSGFPYRGEEWGVWSQNVFLNQRHLTSSIGILMLVLVYLVMRYRENAEGLPEASAAVSEAAGTENFEAPAETDDALGEAESQSDADETVDENAEADEDDAVEDEGPVESEEDDDGENDDEDADEGDDEDEDEDDDDTEGPDLIALIKSNSAYVFCGVILGLLPMWNGAVFLSAACVLAALLLLFPLRKQLIVLAVTAAIVSLPQIIYLKTGNTRPVGYSMFRWGFVIDDAGVFDVLYYTFWTFGFKWVLLAIALYFASGLQRRFIAAVSILLPLTYCFRFSEEVLANHKFINIWLIIVNIFCGFALVKLWYVGKGTTKPLLRLLAVALLLIVTIGGAIDLMPIKNSYWIQMKYDDDRLIEWVKANTDPSAIFLSHRYINHQILLAGRRLFYGDPYYAWSADYDTGSRDVLARKLFESKDAAEIYKILRENNVSYVAIDDQIRKNQVFVQNPNEDVYARSFPLVFTDDKNEYANIRIYKVPDSFTPPASNVVTTDTPGVNVFQAVEGNQPGQFGKPRGIGVDTKGFIYVADTGNSRIQIFKPDGTFDRAFGEAGSGSGQMGEPNGVAVSDAGDIYVTDAKSHKLMRFKPDGSFDKEWRGPEGGFYGPRDLAFGPNKQLYIIDQGGTRIARFDAATEEFTAFGGAGSGEGQFNEPTGITVASNMVIVADKDNNRIQMFDLDGKFVRQWEVLAWEHFSPHFPDVVYDDAARKLYVSSGRSNEILAFDLEGKPLAGFKPEGDAALNNPSSIVIQGIGKARKLLVLSTGRSGLSSFDLDAKTEVKKAK
jgi:sugar lactone lactonase YvrE